MADSSPERSTRAESGEIATSTLAEIYAQQGLLGRALSIYRRMLTRTPDDAEITGRIQSLEQRIAETGAEPAVERAPDPAAARERLPWDPPADDVTPEPAMLEPMVPELATPEPAVQPGATTEAAENGREVQAEPQAEAPRRVGPIDARAFEAWLERR
jgi:hypothetical protein